MTERVKLSFKRDGCTTCDAAHDLLVPIGAEHGDEVVYLTPEGKKVQALMHHTLYSCYALYSCYMHYTHAIHYTQGGGVDADV
jgi:hypothetical protein